MSMREISLAILDVVQNSIDAGATIIEVNVGVTDSVIRFEITDNGVGMTETELKKATESGASFKGSTGYGLALLKNEVSQSGGDLIIKSKSGIGTVVNAKYNRNNQCLIGDLGSTFVALVDEGFDVVLTIDLYGELKCYDTRELKSSAGVAELQSSGALRLIREDINKKTNGGAML